ncbi:UDP-4-amino-4,6-dideoxy-N-acetyl-beta-L-altrosamine transaminase [Chloroflexota bacterium]
MGRADKVLITGGSGLLGSNIARTAAKGYEVYATCNSHPSRIPGCQFVTLDIKDRQKVLSQFTEIKPDVVIHTAGLVNVDYCEEHEDEARMINVAGTENVALAVKEIGAKLISISTDSVFDGERGMYTEEDTPHPLTVYARTKLEAEKRVAHWLPDSIIVRTVFYGWSLHTKQSLAEWVVSSLREGKKLSMWTDAFFTPMLVNNLAEVLLAMYRQNLSGLYHVASSERCSKYDFGLEVARAFGLNGDLIQPSSINEAKLRAHRPKDPSLDTTRVSGLVNSRLFDFKESFARFRELEPVLKGKDKGKNRSLSSPSKKFIPYGHQWLDDEDIAAVTEALKSDWITQGSKVDEFERKTAEYCGARYGVAVSSGTAALHAACAVAGITEGDEVITTPITFAASANAVVYCGGKPVFADIREDTLNIDPSEIRNQLSARTKAILPVDFAGCPVDLDEILSIAKERKLLVIEDAAHALGAEYRGRRIGSISDMTILSFHPVKHITTGEGGMILTNNQDFYEKLKVFRHHGIVRDTPGKGAWYYEIHNLGHNFRLTDFQSALGLSQMNKLDSFIRRRREIAARYDEAFTEMKEIVTPVEPADVKTVYHIYVIQLQPDRLKAGRQEVFDALRAANIGVNVHYLPVHLHPYYRNNFGYKKGDYPRAEAYYERAITLPVFPRMSDEDVDYVIGAVRKVITKYRH